MGADADDPEESSGVWAVVGVEVWVEEAEEEGLVRAASAAAASLSRRVSAWVSLARFSRMAMIDECLATGQSRARRRLVILTEISAWVLTLQDKERTYRNHYRPS